MESTDQVPNQSPETLLLEKQERAQRAWKIAIRSVATVSTVTGLALQIRIVSAPAQSDLYSYSDYYYYPFYQTGWVSPASFASLCVSLGWNIAEFITICVNKRSIHPGAHVGLDLIIWMGLLSSAVIQLVLDYWYPTAVAAGSIKIVSSVLHFVLFVWACVDTDRRRKTQRAQIMAQVTAAVQQQANQQQMQQQRMGTFSGTGVGTGTMNAPPGMALVPIEMLAQLNQPHAAYQPYQPYPEVPNTQDNGQRAPVSPIATVQGVAYSPPR